MITKGQALAALCPGAEWSILNGEITWLDKNQSRPSDEEIVKKIAELEYQEEVEQYKVNRAVEYPDWGSQLDYIYHNGLEAWKTDLVDPVKAKYPKEVMDPEELKRRQFDAITDYNSKYR